MRTNKRPQYLILTGIGLLTIAVLILMITPSTFFSPMVTVIGGDPNKSTTNQVAVVTKTDFSDPTKIQDFPYDIGKWHGVDYDVGNLLGVLKAEAVLMRGYDPDTFTQPVFLVIVAGNSDSAIHEPHYCFTNIQELVPEELVVSNINWAKGASTITLPINKLVSAPLNKDGLIRERRIVLYFYIKSNPLYSDMVTLVEVQALAPLQGSYEGTLKEEKEFLAQAVPYMFEPGNTSSEWHPLITTMAEKGSGGYILIAIMLLIPLSLILFPLIRRRGNTR
jgi:hypothetical protein